ncbi:MAG TPA: D-alanyl-D-alanine carboxypeptidase, partial [Ktedonobacteraceae bacterium]|nr:D-alanyl-D-alanine carboxypeptidase [Ktedonobacteraceae bacterium]
MLRRTLAIILLLLALSIAIGVPVLTFTPLGARVLQSFSPTPAPTPSPILTVRGTPPPVNAKAAYLLDADTNHALDDFNGEQRLPMASTTKIMTALITIETANLDQIVTIHQDAVDEVQKHSGSTANLVVG